MGLINQALESMDFSISNSINSHYTYNNIPVPRVTEILSKMIHKDTLMYWANSLGFKGLRYKEVLNKAANIGTEAHAAIEFFLKDKLKNENNIPFLGFLSWYNMITQDIGLHIEVIYVEHKLVCPYFGGTLDALLKIGEKLFLVDFKTSNYVSSNYFLQLSAYRYMLKTIENINIDGVIVLQLDKDSPGFNEYLLDFSNNEHLSFINNCEHAFLSITYAYYNLLYIDDLYKKIF